MKNLIRPEILSENELKNVISPYMIIDSFSKLLQKDSNNIIRSQIDMDEAYIIKDNNFIKVEKIKWRIYIPLENFQSITILELLKMQSNHNYPCKIITDYIEDESNIIINSSDELETFLDLLFDNSKLQDLINSFIRCFQKYS